jgi:hypothetical protein
MFGALVLGQLALGQATTAKFTPLAAVATIAAITPTAPLTAGISFGASVTLAISCADNLTAPGPLVGDAIVSVAATAPLAHTAPLIATAGLRVSVADVAVIVAGPLLGDITIPFTVGTTSLAVGGLPLAVDATASVTTGARLSSVPATFAATGMMSWITAANLLNTGLGASDVVITFNGAVTANVRVGSITITDELNEAPNTCDFIVDGGPAGVPEHVLFDQPTAYWRLDDPAGATTVGDASGHGSTGTVLGTVTLGQPSAMRDGRTAAAFVPTGRITCGALTLAVTFTIEAWINTSAGGGTQPFFSNRSAASGTGLGAYAGLTSGRAFLYLDGGTPPAFVGPITSLADHHWHHLVFTNNGGVSQLYIDGVLVSETPQARAGAGTGNTALGWDPLNSEFWTGALGDVAIYPQVLSAARIHARYQARLADPRVLPPPVGTDVKIGLGTLQPDNVLFAGEVVRSEQIYLLKPANPSWQINCRDYTFLINRRKVWKKYIDTSATTVATDVVQTCTTGFSTGGIVAGLPPITVQFDGVEVMAALAQIATLVGGYCDVSPTKVVNLFITPPTGSAPDPITGAGSTFKLTPPIGIERDLSQVRTVVKVKGKGQNVVGTSGMAHAAGSAILPVDDASPFGSSAGQAITDDVQILSYSSTSPGGVSAKVGSTSGPPAGSVTPALAPGVVGGLVGAYWWALAFANETGETSLGTPSTQLVVPDRGAPGTGVGLGAASQVGPLIGRYGYRTTFITNRGETLPGPIVQRDAAALVVSQLPNVADSGTGPLLPGAFYQYAVSFVAKWGEALTSSNRRNYQAFGHTAGAFGTALFYPFGGAYGGPYSCTTSIVTALGESLLYNPINMGSSVTSPPEAPLFTGQQNTNGRLETGPTYYWMCTAYHETFGETDGSSWTTTNTFGVGHLQVEIRMPPLPANATGLRLYRSMFPVGGTRLPFKLVGEFAHPPTGYWSFWDGLATEDLGEQFPKQSKRAGVRCGYILNASPEPGVVARRIYRTKAGGSEYFLVGEIQNNFNGSALNETFSDDQLVQRATAVATTGRSCLLTNLPLGPPGTTARRLYRTKAGGGALYLAAEIKDNTSTSWLDSTPDSGLSVAAPGIAALGDAHQLSSIPIGPAGTLARLIYRTRSNGSEYFRVGRLSDNTTTTFLDDVTDSELGDGVPLTSTAGAGAVQLTNIAIGPTGVTKRVLYRTAAGGSPVNGFRYLAALDNNTATTFLDDKLDSDLGRPPDPESSIGAFTGDTSLVLDKVLGFPPSGWIRAGNQYISYTGISGTTLVGIPPLRPVAALTASGGIATLSTTGSYNWQTGDRIMVIGANQSEYNGVRKITVLSPTTVQYPIEGLPTSPATGSISAAPHGAITATIPGASIATTVALLRGVSGLNRAIDVGKRVALWVVRQSAAGIAQLAALEGGDGIREYGIIDDSLDSIAACQRRGEADLQLFQYAQITVTYRSQDTKTRSGKTIHIALPPPQNLTGDFLIQSVRMSNIDVAARAMPFFDVTASNTRFSLEDLIRHLVLDNE